jgi:hypothetical protein
MKKFEVKFGFPKTHLEIHGFPEVP